MQTQKMSLANIKEKLSRAEMKNIMAGSGTSCTTCEDNCPRGTSCKKEAHLTQCYCYTS